MTRTANALGVAVALVSLGCGAADDIATAPVVTPTCTRLEALVPELAAIAEAEGVPGLQAAVRERMTHDIRQGLVRGLLTIVKALPAGAIDGLISLQDRGVLEGLTRPLGDLLRIVQATGETAYDALEVFDRVLVECEGRPLFEVLVGHLRDPGFRSDVETLLSAGLDLDVMLADLGVDVSTLEGRAGFQALSVTLLAAVSSSGFRIDDLLGQNGLLAAIVDPNDPVISALIDAVGRVLAEGPSLTAVQGLCECLLDSDPTRALGGLLFDLLKAGVLESLAGLAKNVAVADAFFAIDSLVVPVLDLLIGDPLLRRELVAALDVLLRRETAKSVLPDMLVLIDNGVLGEVVTLIAALTQDRCQ